MFVVAFASSSGGVGRTTLVAQLASLLGKRKHPVLAIDFDPQNMLAPLLGFIDGPEGAATGWVNWPAEDWVLSGQRNSDGVLFLPFGSLSDADVLWEREALLRRDNSWLADSLLQLDLPSETIVLLDVARAPSLYFEQAMRAAHQVLWVATADVVNYLAWHRLLKSNPDFLVRTQLLFNRFDATRSLQNNILGLFRADSAALISPYLVHRDEAIPTSFAANLSLIDSAPDSQAQHDLQGVLNWLLSRQACVRA